MVDARKHRCSTILNAIASVLVVLLVTLAGTPIYAYFFASVTRISPNSLFNSQTLPYATLNPEPCDTPISIHIGSPNNHLSCAVWRGYH
ncbi:hypothetical protein ABKN59_010803 [Abortiporus biennis]